MKKINQLDRLINEGIFRFGKLVVQDIDNSSFMTSPEFAEQVTCLLHRDIGTGDDYFAMLHDRISRGLLTRVAAPVVRFADGEYAFYTRSLHCNGLYRQAESVAAIGKAMPMHVHALKALSQNGIIAPLIFPGNTRQQRQKWLPLFSRYRGDASAIAFMEWLYGQGIELRQDNYVPFYVVYAYLTSADFARLVHGKKMCIINSDWNAAACRRWFERFSSRPALVCVDIPAEYVATRWEAMRDGVLANIPPDSDICLVGAGVGALPVCVDVTEHFSIPAIDAGHVLNMMNGREDKSNGPRLYTLRNK